MSEMFEKIKKFDTNQEMRIKEQEVRDLLDEFYKKFPFRDKPDSIENIQPIDLYEPSNPVKDYFFYWIEHKLKPFGHISVGSASPWVNASTNIDLFKSLMRIAVDDSISLKNKIDADWPEIKFFGGGRTIAKKIVALYYPDKYLNIFKAKDMEYFCRRLNVQYERQSFDEYGKPYPKLLVGEKYELLTNRLLHYKEYNDITQKWSNIYYGSFLYQELEEVYDEVPRLSTSIQPSQREAIPLNSYGLLFEPKSHEELLYMFSVMHREIGFPYIVKVQTKYPDVIAMNQEGEIKQVELEVFASQFDHDPSGCDLIVCWENNLDPKPDDWPEVVALKDLT